MTTNLTETTPLQLKQLLDTQHAVAILDVRNEEEYAAWRVEGRYDVPMVNIPYFDFIENADEAIARLPFEPGLPIAVLCAKGGSSEFVADVLREHGFDARNVQGGMLGWGELYVALEVPDTGPELTLVQWNRVGKGCLSYLIGAGGEAIVVDPGRHTAQYVAEAERRGLKITHIVDTHLHADHVSGAPELGQATGAAYHLHDADNTGAALATTVTPSAIHLGNVAVEVVQEHTPGHTPGSISLVIAGRYLISGDTLFVNSVGRPDLGGHVDEWAHDLYWTLINKIQQLADSTWILPAHYASQSEVRPDGLVAGVLGDIRHDNPALNVADEAEFTAFIKLHMRTQPDTYSEIRRVNLGLSTACEDQRTALELGKNQCAASVRAPINSSGRA
jgi:glyoxylase-like metal-dependent hydrolase (beta-lactamase superfamily II)